MKQYSEACKRNEEPIAEVLQEVLPEEGRPLVLEVGSGTGQHSVAFARRFDHLLWQPTNPPGQLASPRAWWKEAGLENLLEPVAFDLFEEEPPVDRADLVVAINVIHIAPFAATRRLFEHAAQVLERGSPVLLYGPYRYADRGLEASNRRFDEFLRARDPRSGLRLFEEVDEIAGACGFCHRESTRLPANNDLHRWERQ